MTIVTSRIVYPEGDIQEIRRELRIDQIVDINGNPLALPLPTARMIAYRVYKIARKEMTGEIIIDHHLEQIGIDELASLSGGRF